MASVRPLPSEVSLGYRLRFRHSQTPKLTLHVYRMEDMLRELDSLLKTPPEAEDCPSFEKLREAHSILDTLWRQCTGGDVIREDMRG
jgi:hypothetical protein